MNAKSATSFTKRFAVCISLSLSSRFAIVEADVQLHIDFDLVLFYIVAFYFVRWMQFPLRNHTSTGESKRETEELMGRIDSRRNRARKLEQRFCSFN